VKGLAMINVRGETGQVMIDVHASWTSSDWENRRGGRMAGGLSKQHARKEPNAGECCM
jgi:hypothetical protein